MARKMTHEQARSKAQSLWSRYANLNRPHQVGDRTQVTCARHKNVVDRFEVGYREVISKNPEEWSVVILGSGPTWEIAFDRALSNKETSNG